MEGEIVTRLAVQTADDSSKTDGAGKISQAQVDRWRDDPSSLKARAKLITHAASLNLESVRAALEATKGADSPNDWVYSQALMERWAELDVENL